MAGRGIVPRAIKPGSGPSCMRGIKMSYEACFSKTSITSSENRSD